MNISTAQISTAETKRIDWGCGFWVFFKGDKIITIPQAGTEVVQAPRKDPQPREGRDLGISALTWMEQHPSKGRVELQEPPSTLPAGEQ